MDPSTGRTVFSLQGKNLKLDERSDIEPHLNVLRDSRESVKEVRLSGNTLGVGSSEALAEVLKELKNLEASLYPTCFPQVYVFLCICYYILASN
jgi:Ran GTPase-activating protein 1